MKRYSDVTGRADRRQFWGFTLVYLGVVVGSAILGGALGLTITLPLGAPNLPVIRLEILGPLVVLLHVVPNWAISCRRLHDVGCSAWFLILGIFPLIGPLILMGFFLWPGEVTENTYGPPPA